MPVCIGVRVCIRVTHIICDAQVHNSIFANIMIHVAVCVCVCVCVCVHMHLSVIQIKRLTLQQRRSISHFSQTEYL